MSEKLNPVHMAIGNAVAGRAKADAQELFKNGIRPETLSESVAQDFANRFKKDFEGELQTFPVVRPNKEMIDEITQKYRDGLSLFLGSEELKNMLSK